MKQTASKAWWLAAACAIAATQAGAQQYGDPNAYPQRDPSAYPQRSYAPEGAERVVRCESIDWNHLSIVVERCHRCDLSGSNVDEAIGVERSVVVADVEGAVGRHHQHERVEGAVIVRQIETSFEGKCFAATDIGQPDNRSSNASSGKCDALFHDRIATDILIDRGADDLCDRRSSFEVDRSGNRAAGAHQRDFVWLSCGRDHRRSRCDTVVRGTRTISRVRRRGVVARAGECDDAKYRKAEKPAEH